MSQHSMDCLIDECYGTWLLGMEWMHRQEVVQQYEQGESSKRHAKLC
jgi:hypothetical protein